MLTNEEQKLLDKIEEWSADFKLCAEQALGISTLDAQQILILNDVNMLIRVREKVALNLPLTEEEEPYRGKFGISVKSAKGVGKTAILAIILLCMQITLGRHQTNLITAPRKEDLKDKIFSEISHWISHSREKYGENAIVNHLLGLEGLKLYRKGFGKGDKEAEGKQGVTLGRTCNRNADMAMQQATLQGFHDRYMLLGADESFGIPDAVFEPLITTMTGEVNFAFLIGNPTRNSGYAYDTFNKNKNYWITRTISAEDSTLVNKEHIRILKEQYRDYPNLYRVNVLGEFPLDEEDALIPFSKIMEAVDLYKDLEPNDKRYCDEGIVFGCDIGCGGDLSVVYKRQGIKVDKLGTKNERDTMVTARWIGALSEVNEPTKICVDGIAWGKGVLDRLKELGYSQTCFVDARRKPSDSGRFKNLRAELYIKLAEMFINNQIAIPDDEQLIKELSVLKIVNPLGADKIQIVSKKDLKAQGIESPNEADALMMTVFFNDTRLRIQKATNDRYNDTYLSTMVKNTTFMSA